MPPSRNRWERRAHNVRPSIIRGFDVIRCLKSDVDLGKGIEFRRFPSPCCTMLNEWSMESKSAAYCGVPCCAGYHGVKDLAYTYIIHPYFTRILAHLLPHSFPNLQYSPNLLQTCSRLAAHASYSFLLKAGCTWPTRFAAGRGMTVEDSFP